MKRRLEQIEKSIDRYMAAMDTADLQEPEITEAGETRLNEKAKGLKERMEKLKALEAEMPATEDKQLSLTDPDKMAVRRCTAEHPFGTLKSWMGATHFLTRTIERVSAEKSPHVLAYNIKRMIKIMGIGPLLAAIRAHGEALTAFLRAAMASVSQIGLFLTLFVVIVPKTAPS